MHWEIKKINNKHEFDELEIFYREKFPSIYHNKLSSDYLYWKLKKNKCFFGEILVAVYNNKIVGSISLTFKKAIVNNKKILVAEIGDSYVDFGIQKKILKQDINLKKLPFNERSIFGSLVTEILKYAEIKKINLIYGFPNNKSFQGYTKYLKFKKIVKPNISNFILPSIDYKINNFKYAIKLINFCLKIYRFLICQILYNKLDLIESKNLDLKDFDQIFLKKSKNYELDKSPEYFLEKYKLNPEKNFIFMKIFKKNNLRGIYVLKRLEGDKKYIIIDSFINENYKQFLALKINIKYNFSVSFWDDEKVLNFYKRLVCTFFKTKKINIIYLDKDKTENKLFFHDINLGYSDNF